MWFIFTTFHPTSLNYVYESEISIMVIHHVVWKDERRTPTTLTAELHKCEEQLIYIENLLSFKGLTDYQNIIILCLLRLDDNYDDPNVQLYIIQQSEKQNEK